MVLDGEDTQDDELGDKQDGDQGGTQDGPDHDAHLFLTSSSSGYFSMILSSTLSI